MRFILPIVILFPGLVLAQISGRVIDAHTRLPLENVQITLSGGILLYTDESGTFHLNPENTEETVLVSHIGYVTREFKTVGRETMLLELLPDHRQDKESDRQFEPDVEPECQIPEPGAYFRLD